MVASAATREAGHIELQTWTQGSTRPIALGQVPLPTPDESRCTSDLEGNNHVIQQLAPADGGPAAWRLLIAAFVFEALLWGLPISFGVFQDYYSTLPEFEGQTSSIALVGTLAQGLSYLGSPFSAMLTKRFPKHQRLQIYIGWPVCIGSLVAGSFTNSLGGLIATQGVMYGLGFITLTYPIISMADEWWIARKGMAFGIISAASGASGTIMPFIISAMLQRWGHKATLRAIAVAMAILTGPLIPSLKGRLPPAERSALGRTDWKFLQKPLFRIFATSTFIQGLGFFFPSLYLPSYATAIGLSSTQGALILAVMAFAQLLGQFAFGFLSDKQVSVSKLAISSSIMATIATLAVWGLAKSLGLLLLFGIVYGFFGYAFGAMRAAMGKSVADDSTAVVASYSVLVFLQGIGNVLAGPISSALMKKTVISGAYGILKYKNVVIFSGICMFGSAAVIVSWVLRPNKLIGG